MNIPSLNLVGIFDNFVGIHMEAVLRDMLRRTYGVDTTGVYPRAIIAYVSTLKARHPLIPLLAAQRRRRVRMRWWMISSFPASATHMPSSRDPPLTRALHSPNRSRPRGREISIAIAIPTISIIVTASPSTTTTTTRATNSTFLPAAATLGQARRPSVPTPRRRQRRRVDR
jgi:hypothetical protein